MKDKKVLIVTTVASTIRGFLYPHIEFLQKKGYQVLIASNFEKQADVREYLINIDCKAFDINFSRNPLEISKMIYSLKEIKNIAKSERIDVLYTHTPIASFISRYVFRKYDTKIVYFAHGLHFFKGAPLKNWIIFYPLERLALFWTDFIFTINEEDYKRLKKTSSKASIINLPGVGIDLRFLDNLDKGLQLTKRQLLLKTGLSVFIDDEDFTIITVAELNKNKNQITIIKAVEQLVKEGLKIKYLIVGSGHEKDILNTYIEKKKLKKNVFLLGFRRDVSSLLLISDVLVSMSFREGLPVNVMEAMAAGKPVIGSNIRGTRDLISNRDLLIDLDHNTTNVLKSKLRTLYFNKKMCLDLGKENLEWSKHYEISSVLKRIEEQNIF